MIKALMCGTSLVVQWLRLHVSTAGGVDSIHSLGTNIPHATQHGQKKKKSIDLFNLSVSNMSQFFKKINFFRLKFFKFILAVLGLCC